MPGASLKPHFFYILLALAEGQRHGLAIARDVQALSDGSIKLWPATLYGSLDELRTRKWIEELEEHPHEESERKRYYRLTRTGRAGHGCVCGCADALIAAVQARSASTVEVRRRSAPGSFTVVSSCE